MKINIKTSVNNLHTKGERLMRCEGWTTNYFWIIKSEYEPTALKKRESNTEISIELIKRLFDSVWYNPALITCDIVEMDYTKYDRAPVAILKAGEDTIHINAHFLNMFLKAGADTIKARDDLRNTPVVIVRKNEVIGLIMPIRL